MITAIQKAAKTAQEMAGALSWLDRSFIRDPVNNCRNHDGK
jgi:hypothetical protein